MEAEWDGDVLGDFSKAEEAQAAVALAKLMSAISERCYAAGWMDGTEFVLWDALARGPRDWGRDRITADDVAKLTELSDKSGGWITNSFDGPARFVTREKFEQLARSRGSP
jgi:hypothetical protein